MECSFCKKVFGSKTALEHHKKTAKYCLEIQGINSIENFECLYCKKHLSTNERLLTHTIICKEKKKQENIEKEKKIETTFYEQKKYYEEKLKEKDSLLKEKNDYIEKLEARLEKFEDSILSKTDKKMITSTPNHTTNNTTNIVINHNYLNLNDIPKMAAFLEEKLDKEVVAGGQKGLALLLSNTVLKDKYKCVDPSRQNFEFTNELGEVERDVKAKKLTNALIKSDICSKSGEIGMELWKKEDGSTDSLRYEAHSKNVLEMINFTRDNSTFRSELSALTS
jgi:hypothetical protein